jgi:uncharacterized protein YlzI (FlbEa/FlbD family)
MAVRIAGTAFLKVNGAQLPLKGNFTVSPGSLERAMIAGQDYVHGFSELPRVPYIEGDISSLPDVLFEDLEAMVDVTVTAELNNGRVYVLKEAACKSAVTINTRDGQATIRWEGTSCEEI